MSKFYFRDKEPSTDLSIVGFYFNDLVSNNTRSSLFGKRDKRPKLNNSALKA